jgi:hypothetical protein
MDYMGALLEIEDAEEKDLKNEEKE